MNQELLSAMIQSRTSKKEHDMSVTLNIKTINTKSKHKEFCGCCDGVYTKDDRRKVKKSIRHNLKNELNKVIDYDNY